MTESLLLDAAAVVTTMATLVLAVAVARAAPRGRSGARPLLEGVGLALEFLLAAGLLRLATLDDFGALGLVAAVVLLRRLISHGLQSGVRALEAPPASVGAPRSGA